MRVAHGYASDDERFPNILKKKQEKKAADPAKFLRDNPKKTTENA